MSNWDPREIWIAIRTDLPDPLEGTGAPDDPFDGGVKLWNGLTCALVYNSAMTIGTTRDLNGYSVNDLIAVSGVQDPDAGVYNAVHAISEVLSGYAFTLLLSTQTPTVPPRRNGATFRRGQGSSFSGTLMWPWVKVTTQGSYTIAEGDVVRISGAADPAFNGDFIAQYVSVTGSTSTFFCRMNSKPAANASLTNLACARVEYRFDTRLRSLQSATEAVVVHLGPGVFETRGYSPGRPSWQPASGQKIRGAGMGATTLKLVQARLPADWWTGSPTHAIGADYTPFIDHLEVSDLTIDCNVPGQTALPGADFADVSCGAIAVGGSYQRIRQVRVINFGTQTKDVECFIIGVAGAHPALAQPVNAVIEDCVIEQPSRNNVRETSALATWMTPPAIHRACVIRNNWINMEFGPGVSSFHNPFDIATAIPFALRPATDSAPTRTYILRTVEPHHRTAGVSNVVVNSVLVPEMGTTDFQLAPSSAFIGSFKVDSVDGERTLYFTLRKNPDFRLQRTNNTKLTRVADGTQFTVVLLASLDTDPAPLKYRIYTAANPGCNVGDLVRISGVEIPKFVNGWFAYVPSLVFNNDPNDPQNASFEVLEVGWNSQLQFHFITIQLHKPLDGYYHIMNSVIGVNFQAMGANGGTGGVAEGNRIWGAIYGHYHDTGSFKDVTVRNNLIHDVLTGGYSLLKGTDYDPLKFPGSKNYQGTVSYALVGGRHVATFTLRDSLQNNAPHGLSKGNIVKIERVLVGDTRIEAFQGYFAVDSVPHNPAGKPTSFTYILAGPPPSGLNYPLPGECFEFYRIQNFEMEGNHVWLHPSLPPDCSPSFATGLADSSPNGAKTWPQIYGFASIRENAYETLAPEGDARAWAVTLASCASGTVEDNLTPNGAPNPLAQWWSRLNYSHNRSLEGESKTARMMDNPGFRASQLETRIEDAFVLGL